MNGVHNIGRDTEAECDAKHYDNENRANNCSTVASDHRGRDLVIFSDWQHVKLLARSFWSFALVGAR